MAIHVRHPQPIHEPRPMPGRSPLPRLRTMRSMAIPEPTERLVFREMTDADLEPMAALLGDPEVMTYYAHPKDRAEALDWIRWNRRLYEERGFGLWVIELRETGEFVGDCGLTPQEVEGVAEIEVGYHVRRPMQGRGYATEAATASRDFARDELGLSRLIAIIHPDNTASQRVAEHIGLTLEKEVDRHSGRKRIYAGRTS
jgi:RimJ/RimL family protein N-acetyltransferase